MRACVYVCVYVRERVRVPPYVHKHAIASVCILTEYFFFFFYTLICKRACASLHACVCVRVCVCVGVSVFVHLPMYTNTAM